MTPICEVNGVGTVSDETVRRSLKKVMSELEGGDLLRAAMAENSRCSLQEKSENLNIPKRDLSVNFHSLNQSDSSSMQVCRCVMAVS